MKFLAASSWDINQKIFFCTGGMRSDPSLSRHARFGRDKNVMVLNECNDSFMPVLPLKTLL
jgi:hypothetical protein